MWRRVIYDEMHVLRNMRQLRYTAAYRVRAKSRLGITGTPFHKSYTDLRAQMLILRVPGMPVGDKWRALRASGKRTARRFIRRLAHTVMLRALRTDEETLHPSLTLPPLEVTTVRSEFHTPMERQLYDRCAALYRTARGLTPLAGTQPDGAIGLGSDGTARPGPTVLVMHCILWQMCVMPFIVRCRLLRLGIDLTTIQAKDTEPAPAAEAAALPLLRSQIPESDCTPTVLPLGVPSAPTKSLRAARATCVYPDDWTAMNSTKVRMLIAHIQANLGATEKALVFSLSVRAIDIAARALARVGIRSRRIVGTMSSAERARSCATFETDASVRVLFVSLKAGSQGWNGGQAASFVYHLQATYNPQTLVQANNRMYRHGQRNAHCRVVHLVIANTIEDEIVECCNTRLRRSNRFMAERVEGSDADSDSDTEPASDDKLLPRVTEPVQALTEKRTATSATSARAPKKKRQKTKKSAQGGAVTGMRADLGALGRG